MDTRFNYTLLWLQFLHRLSAASRHFNNVGTIVSLLHSSYLGKTYERGDFYDHREGKYQKKNHNSAQ
jgi:hypothetical protein